jgi:hypothetical protein
MAHIGAALGARHDVKLAIPVEYCRASGVLVFGFRFALRVRVMARARATRARARVGDRGRGRGKGRDTAARSSRG